jgi:DNA-binding NarL/FixJ family response regulator
MHLTPIFHSGSVEPFTLPLRKEQTIRVMRSLRVGLSNASVNSTFQGGCMATSSIRVLVVDDYEPFRRFVCSALEQMPDLQVIGEALDGLEAVQKAQELKPELILLDIGLPKLDGLEAAKRIHQVVPDARIMFLTQNTDKDVVQAALRNGAKGYVLKTDAGSELLTAVAGVLGGDNFVSSGIEVDESSDTEDTVMPLRLK